MNTTLDKLAYSLFQKSSVEECSIEELQSLTEKFPFFATAQLLLSKKLKETGDPAYKEHLQKTSLFFQNPLWLENVLNEKTRSENAGSIDANTYEHTSALSFEDFDNDEQVVENPKYEIPGSTIHEPVPTPETPVFSTVIETNLPEPQQEQKEEETTKSEPTPEPTPESNPEKEPLLFEPYHTVDYFASQGIKTVLEEKPTDRFGKQLKSFTEWLKILKKAPLHEVEKTDTSSSESEEKVVNMALHSIDNREVVTEAMAEVWIKQGQTEKALEVYNKLSLLNPSKSSYFAGLIEKLKTH